MNDFKDQGNKSFGTGDYLSAVEFYQQGLAVCPKKRPERALLHGNLAACQIKLEKYEEAIKSCDRGRRLPFFRSRGGGCR